MRFFRIDDTDRNLDELLGTETTSDYWERPDDAPLDPRPGISCFCELDDLCLYFLRRGCLHVNLKVGRIVELEGRWSGSVDHDDDEGAVLIFAERIVGFIEPDHKRIAELEAELEAEGFDPDDFFRKYDFLTEDC